MAGYSNPARFFVDANTTKKFTFEPRKIAKLFYVQVRSSRHISISILIPAMDEEDARMLLRAALLFKCLCGKEYKRSQEESCKRYATDFYIEQAEKEIKAAEEIINTIDGLKTTDVKVTVEEVVPNQMFKTGWALNDTI